MTMETAMMTQLDQLCQGHPYIHMHIYLHSCDT